MIGISDVLESTATYPGDDSGHSYVIGGNKYDAGTYTASVGSTWVEGDVIGVVVDCDGGTIKYYINDVLQTTSTILTTTTWLPAISVYYSDSSIPKYSANFGQKPFKFPPPEGFQPLNLANLPSPGMTRPDQYYGISLYTGDGTSPRKIGGFGFQPDLVWYKERSEARDWQVYDSVRGVGPAKNLVTNTTYAQTANDDTSYGYTSSFNRDGFTVTDGTGGGNANIYTNKNGQTYASWCWKAGGNKNTFNIDDVGYSTAAAAGLTGGTITPTGASVGTKQGFSIIKTNLPGSNTASTFSHGLTQAPDFALVKPTGVNFQWDVYHKSLGKDAYLVLNTTAAQVTGATTVWNSTDPTSSVFHLGDAWTGGVGTNQPVIAYLWHDVPGVQKFGSYTGNQNTNGPYVEIGFKPALLIIKSSSASSTNWRIIDDTRRPYNWGANDSTSQGGPWIKINSNAAEANERPVDLLSNGFKIQGAWGGDINYDGGTPTYIYMAWAESPMHNLYGGQSNAR